MGVGDPGGNRRVAYGSGRWETQTEMTVSMRPAGTYTVSLDLGTCERRG
jgi:hypothetical protein